MVLEWRDCVANPADYVGEWNWCIGKFLWYMFGYSSLFWTLLTFLIGLLVCGRGSSNWGITKNLWWSDITAGFSHHTCRGSVFLISQVFDQRHHFPSHHYNNHDEAESMVCKLRQESPGEKLVSVSSGQQVLLRLYHWSLKCEYPKKLFNHPTRLGVCRY